MGGAEGGEEDVEEDDFIQRGVKRIALVCQSHTFYPYGHSLSPVFVELGQRALSGQLDEWHTHIHESRKFDTCSCEDGTKFVTACLASCLLCSRTT